MSLPHPREEETHCQRGAVTCSGSHSGLRAVPLTSQQKPMFLWHSPLLLIQNLGHLKVPPILEELSYLCRASQPSHQVSSGTHPLLTPVLLQPAQCRSEAFGRNHLCERLAGQKLETCCEHTTWFCCFVFVHCFLWRPELK